MTIRYLLASIAFLLVSSSADTGADAPAPAPKENLGIAAYAMVAGAVFLARRLRG